MDFRQDFILVEANCRIAKIQKPLFAWELLKSWNISKKNERLLNSVSCPDYFKSVKKARCHPQ